MKVSKYRNQKVVVDGLTFDSKKEAKRYGELKMMVRAGLITRLQLQVVYRLQVNGFLICKYIADFVYHDVEKNVTQVEDVKGFRTEIYKLKKKLMQALHGIEIKEIK